MNTGTKKKGLLLIIFSAALTTYAQQSDLGNWLIYFGNKQITNKVNWHHELQYRNYNAIGDLEQLLIRSGIGFNITENNNNILLGYGHIISENYYPNSDSKFSVSEHRIYQQFITKQTIGRVSLQHRYRFEQRWIEEVFKLRFRYFLAVAVPLNNAEMLEKTVYLSAYNEIFINTKSTVFDRNRLYGGLGYKLTTKLRLELGYMNQFLNASSRDQANLIAFFNF